MFNSNLEHLIANRKKTTCLISVGLNVGTWRWTLKALRSFINLRSSTVMLVVPITNSLLPCQSTRASRASNKFRNNCNFLLKKLTSWFKRTATRNGMKSFGTCGGIFWRRWRMVPKIDPETHGPRGTYPTNLHISIDMFEHMNVQDSNRAQKIYICLKFCEDDMNWLGVHKLSKANCNWHW
jgi:hypothetical protein